MDAADTRGLLILFEPGLTLSLLPTWWGRDPVDRLIGQPVRGHRRGRPDLLRLDSRPGRFVLGVTFLPPEGLPDAGVGGLSASLGSLPYVEDAGGMPIVWFSDEREEDPDARVSQDFAAALYATGTGSWALALNIDWLPADRRDHLRQIPARWVDAECRLVKPGEGVALCGGRPAPGLYGLRGWFGSSEGR